MSRIRGQFHKHCICSSFFSQDAGWCRLVRGNVPLSVWHYSPGLGVLLAMCMSCGIGCFNWEVGILKKSDKFEFHIILPLFIPLYSRMFLSSLHSVLCSFIFNVYMYIKHDSKISEHNLWKSMLKS